MTFDRSNLVCLAIAMMLVCGTATSLAGDDGAASEACRPAREVGPVTLLFYSMAPRKIGSRRSPHCRVAVAGIQSGTAVPVAAYC